METPINVILTAAAVTTAVTVVGSGLAWLVLPRIKAWIQKEIASPVQETRHEVKNDHATNLRVELDRRDEAMHVRFDELDDHVRRLTGKDDILNHHLTALSLAVGEHLRWSRDWVRDHESNKQ